MRGLKEGYENASVAEQIVANFFVKVKSLIKDLCTKNSSSNQEETVMVDANAIVIFIFNKYRKMKCMT